MALNHNHVIFDNEVLANEIEDQFNSHLDLMRFCTVDRSLEGTAGMRKTIHRYHATDGTQILKMGEGNDKNIEVSFTDEEYRILLAQNRFPYYDEEQMTDPMTVPVGVRHMSTDMFNNTNALVFAEFAKAEIKVYADAYDFNAFVDAAAAIDLPEIKEGTGELPIEVFAFVNRKQAAIIRKNLKDDLKYIEAFVRKGYIGSVAGINLYEKKDAPDDYIVVATRLAVTYFVKKGTEVEQERDSNTRLNEIFSRKYYVPALTDATQVCHIVLGEDPSDTDDAGTDEEEDEQSTQD